MLRNIAYELFGSCCFLYAFSWNRKVNSIDQTPSPPSDLKKGRSLACETRQELEPVLDVVAKTTSIVFDLM